MDENPTGTPTPAPTMRSRLAEARAVVVGTKGLRTRVSRQAASIASLRGRLDALRERVDRQETRLKEIEALAKEVRRATQLSAAEHERRDTQFGTIEVRLADLEEHLADVRSGLASAPVDADQLAEGSRLLEEVRTEHARVRARMQVVSAYEERLRRVEESVAELFEGDQRHPV